MVQQATTFNSWLLNFDDLGFSLDLREFLAVKPLDSTEQQRLDLALKEIAQLEQGAIANPDENRMVGHYWLRSPELAPTEDLAQAIRQNIKDVSKFSDQVLSGEIRTSAGKKFESLLLIGIGGSALGPQLLADAFRGQGLNFFSIDNTDPDGLNCTLEAIPDLETTLVLVISKSGGTPETRNGEYIVTEVMKQNVAEWHKHFVAITGVGSALDKRATQAGWLAKFPMWDWVGGRTSIFSAVGLLPAALLGVDTALLLQGAREMDQLTRLDLKHNPAALFSAAIWRATRDAGLYNMVVLPYRDRLLLLSRYLQQLVMESIGKQKNLFGEDVFEGLNVFGNKGSTDQHAFVQQLRDGRADFFAVFIEILKARPGLNAAGESSVAYNLELEGTATAADFLAGFLRGTQRALREQGRPSIHLVFEELSATTIGALIAFFERVVGIYGAMCGINPYHQPGVEAGKKAAAQNLELREKILAQLESGSAPGFKDIISENAGLQRSDIDWEVYWILRRLRANGQIVLEGEGEFIECRYRLVKK